MWYCFRLHGMRWHVSDRNTLLFQQPEYRFRRAADIQFYLDGTACGCLFGKRDHMRMGFLADKIEGTPRKVLEIVIELLVMAMVGCIMIFGGVSIMKLTMTQSTASLGIPMGIVYAILPISGVLIFVYGILNIIDLWHGTERETREVKE